MINPALFSSAKEDWATPQSVFDELDKEFGFVLDAAASRENAKCKEYFTKEEDALNVDWAREARVVGSPGAAVWLNPPYGRGIGKWIEKAARTSAQGTTVVCLIPSRTDTKYWHDWIWNAVARTPLPHVEVRFIKGRLKFGGVATPAPFPSVVVVFRGH